MSELPKGWVWARFHEVAEVASDLVDPRATPNAIHIAPNHIESKSGVLLSQGRVSEDEVISPKHRFSPGQILYSKIRPYLAKAVLANDSGLCSADMYPINTSMDASFMLRWVLSDEFTDAACGHQGRSVLPKINQNALNTLPIPVPPLAEQARISDRLEDLLARSRRAKEELAAIPALLERYRQSVLAAAFRGDLTADWRAKNPEVEPASELLKRTRLERRRRWEEAELARLTAKGKAPTDEKWKGRYEEPSAVETHGLLPLPEGWCWAGLSELATLQLGQRRAPEFAEEASFPYVRAGNITWRGLDLSDVKHMGFLHPEPLFLRPGDVLLNEASGSPAEVGKPALWRGEVPNCCFQATVLRVRPAATSIIGEWLYLVFLGEARAGRFAAMAPGMGMVHLSAERMRNWPIPLAPTEEQTALSALVQQALDWSYRLQDELGTLSSGADALDRSILTRAFRGELVPQDPTDEPASVLLDRIRAERAAAPAKKPGRKPRSPKL